MEDYRSLQKLAEQQAAITGDPKTRKALEEMAKEYARLAELTERSEPPKE